MAKTMHVCQLIKIYIRKKLLKELEEPNETEIIPAGGGGGALKGMLDVAKCYGVENLVLISLNETFTVFSSVLSFISSLSRNDFKVGLN